MLNLSRARTPIIAVVAVCLVVAGLLVYRASEQKTVVAWFEASKGIYVGDEVTVLGHPVGTITAIDPEPEGVRVEMSIDDDVDLPADAKAAIVSKSLVAVRSIVVGPVYQGGPKLDDGAEIPLTRTTVPVEYDEVKEELVRLTEALGPNGANADGAASRLVASSAQFLDGKGVDINTTIQNLSVAAETLADNRGEIFATLRNLDLFVTTLRDSDQLVRDFEAKLAEAAQVLDGNRDEILAGIDQFTTLMQQTPQWFAENGQILADTLASLEATTSVLSDNRQSIADLLQILPGTLSNFLNIMDPRGPAITGELAVSNFGDPSYLVCGGLLALQPDRGRAMADCRTAIDPLVSMFKISPPPVGANPLTGNGMGPGRVQTPQEANLLGTPGTEENGFAGLDEILNPDLGGN